MPNTRQDNVALSAFMVDPEERRVINVTTHTITFSNYTKEIMVDQITLLIIGIVIGAIIAAIILSGFIERNMQARYEARLEEWKVTSLTETVKNAVNDALNKQRATVKGLISEQLAPLLPEFTEICNPADARFLGNPIDYIVFKNMTCDQGEEKPIEILLMDVKTGDAGLSQVQRRVKEAVDNHRVSFHVLRTGSYS
jgi:predicted Holliday junction resolvase-like endonuclease